MANDISLDATPVVVEPREFAAFHDEVVEQLGRALALACGDDHLGAMATTAALVKVSQRWRRLADHPHILGWAFDAGVAHAAKTLNDQAEQSINRATGGYIRGLGLADALATLPLHQRSALVGAYYLHWPDEQAAAGVTADTTTITRRRVRAVGFLAHHVRQPTAEVESALREHLAGTAVATHMEAPDLGAVERQGRRGTFGTRLLIMAAAVLVIAMGGALFRVSAQPAPVAEGPKTVTPPTNSTNWFQPISDGGGGFVALEVSGSSQFVRSADGVDWFDDAKWNSRALDLRTRVTSFVRSGGQYVTTVETAPSVRSFVPPRIATSTNLRDWEVREVDLDELPEIPGLHLRYEVLSVAVAGDIQLVAVRIDESVDYPYHGIARSDVCVEDSDVSRFVIHLCDGARILIERPVTSTPTAFLAVSEDGDPFDFFPAPPLIDPWSITSLGSAFAAVTEVDGEIFFSDNGRDWFVGARPFAGSRQTLVEGSSSGATMVIVPDAAGWTSELIDADGTISRGTVPITIDPAAVWAEPDLAVGPAGWTLFVTASRPWERGDVEAGWAIEADDWVVTQLPDSQIISARSVDGTQTLRYGAEALQVRTDDNGVLTLFDPDMVIPLVAITPAMIEQSRAIPAEAGPQAQVFFSADGQRWRSIWQNEQDTWSGSLAVGDDEVVLSGAQLTGFPISISLDE